MIVSPGKYKVRRGDSLWRIAEQECGTWHAVEQIRRLNRLRPNRPLLIGEFLVLPGREQAVDRHSQAVSSNGGSGRLGTAPTAAPAQSSQRAVAPHQGSSSDRSALLPARPVLFPKLQYKCDHVVLEVPIPQGKLECKFTGQFTMNRQGIITGGLTFTPQGMQVEYEKPAEEEGALFFSHCEASLDFSTKPITAKVALAAGTHLRFGNMVLATVRTELDPLEGLKYVYEPAPISFVHRGWQFDGVLGYELIYKRNPDEDDPKPQSATRPVRAGVHVQWRKIGGGLLIAGAVVLVILDLAKDGATLGAGAAESPISFAAAARLSASGYAMLAGAP